MPLQRRHGVAVLNQARAHVDAGDLAAAQELLSKLLEALPADPRKARPAEAEAVALQTGVLLSLGHAHAARGWAAYGHATFRRLYGDHDRRTLHTLGLLAAVLTRVGAHGRAAQRYQRLIEIFSELDGPKSERALAARADLATVEHARGHCATARQQLATVISEHQAAFGTSHPVGVRMLARLATMWRDCGNLHQAQALLARAREGAVGLGRPMQDLLGAVANAPADSGHVCQPRADLEPAAQESPHMSGSVAYLPAHPLLVPWEPLPPLASGRKAAARQLPPAALALTAAIVGIVAVTVLFLLLISTVRGR